MFKVLCKISTVVLGASWLVIIPNAGAADGVTKEQVDAAKNAIDLRIYESTQDLLVKQKEAEVRKAIAEAERAEALAKLPPTEIKALPGSVSSDKMGAAGLVKAFDLAKDLARVVCERTRTSGDMMIYDATAIAGIVSAMAIDKELDRLTQELHVQNAQLQKVTAVDASARIAPLLAVASITAGIKGVADLASLFKSNVTVAGTSYGDGTRNLFVTALAEACGAQVVGLGSGYLGELDTRQYDALRKKLDALLTERRALFDESARIKKLADAEKDPRKTGLNNLVGAAGALLKQVDAFVESLKATEVSDKSPLYNAARYATYAARTGSAKVLDFDMRLEGLAITRENIFTGQSLRLSGVAFLTYKVYERDGKVLRAETLRRISPPVKVDLRGADVTEDFWTGGAAAK